MTYEILPIAEDHIEGFRQAVGVVARERKYLSTFDAFPPESTREFVLNNIKNGYPQFVVVSEGKVVGWCDVTPRSKLTQKHCGVMGLGLLPEFRGKGIGRKPLQITIDAAFAYGLKRVELDVYEQNVRAFLLYKNLGFELEGIRKKACSLKEGEYIDIYAMALMRL